MLVMSKGGLSAKQAEHYYQEKYSQDDYYTEQQQIAGQWVGAGADCLGLQGEVSPEAFKAVLEGHHPGTGEALVPEHNGKRLAGWDATLNAPKSISLQALVGGDERLRDAHRQAVERTLVEFEKHVQTRNDRGQKNVPTGNMVAAQFEHISARPSRAGRDKGIGADPHLHTHVVIANLTQRQDGEWRAVQPLDLYRSQAFATAIYRSELSRSVQELGYDITHTDDRGGWELKGYSRQDIEAFSHRRQDIEKQMTEDKTYSPKMAQQAAHATRLGKEKRSEVELKREWRQREMGLGLDLRTRTDDAMIRDHKARWSNAKEAVDYAREHLTEREAVIPTRALEMAALQRGTGTVVLEEVREQIMKQTRHEHLIAIDEGTRFTTQEMLKLERDNVQLMTDGQGHARPLVESYDVAAFAKEKRLYTDQADVVKQTLSSRNWLSSIEGKAGATKTTTVGAMRELLEVRGRNVQGFGPTTGSVRALEEAGVKAKTVASLLTQRIEPGAAKNAVWIVDESSLLATRQVNALLHRAREAQVSRVIFVGDQGQHGAIEAGRPIAQLQAAGMETARLDTIRRQRDPELRKAVELASKGNTTGAVDILISQGRVTEIADKEQRHNAIAEQYTKSIEAGQNVLVVSPANAERTALNMTIRKTLQDRGQLLKEGINHNVLITRNITKAEREYAGSYREGDVLRYRNGSKKYGLAAGEYVKVEEVDARHNKLTIRTDAGAVHTYSPGKLKGVEVYREEPRELAIGERIQFRAPMKEEKIPNGALGSIEKIEGENVTIALDSGQSLTAPLKDLRHLEHGYTVTSHSSQGATVDRVLVNIDTEHHVGLVNQQQFYVSLSRARHDAHIFTNNQGDLAHGVSRSLPKTMALDVAALASHKQENWRREPAGHEYKIERNPAEQSRGMRIRR